MWFPSRNLHQPPVHHSFNVQQHWLLFNKVLGNLISMWGHKARKHTIKHKYNMLFKQNLNIWILSLHKNIFLIKWWKCYKYYYNLENISKLDLGKCTLQIKLIVVVNIINYHEFIKYLFCKLIQMYFYNHNIYKLDLYLCII